MSIESQTPWYGNISGGEGDGLTAEQIAALATKQELIDATAGKKVENIVADQASSSLIISYTDATPDTTIDLSYLTTDVYLEDGSFDKTSGILKLTNSDNQEFSIDISDFISSGELTTALNGTVTSVTLSDDGSNIIVKAIGKTDVTIALPPEVDLSDFVPKSEGGSFEKNVSFNKGDANATVISGNDVYFYSKKGTADEVKFTINMFDNGDKVLFRPGSDFDNLGFDYTSSTWTIGGKEIYNNTSLPTKDSTDIINKDDTPAVFKPIEINTAISKLALTPYHAGLIRNGSLTDGDDNISLSGTEPFMSKEYAALFGSQGTIKIDYYRRLETIDSIGLNPMMSYEFGMSIMVNFDENSPAYTLVYPYTGFKDVFGVRLMNGHVYVQNENKPMTIIEYAPVGSTIIKVDEVKLEPSDGTNRTLKLPIVHNGIDYNGTTFSNKFISANYVIDMIDFDLSTVGGQEIHLKSPSVNAVSVGDIIYQSRHEGTYPYIAPKITYAYGPLKGQEVAPTDATVDVVRNKVRIYKAADGKMFNLKWYLSGSGQTRGEIPLGVYGTYLGALLAYGTGVDDGINLYAANMYAKVVDKLPTE